MNVDEIKGLPTGEKIQIMEAIWEDFREKFEDTELTAADKALLDERRERVAQGAARLHNWDAVKDALGQNG
ncbi:MAG: addiction module protein [Akkermansiaceae bacterium]|nr:addiction module protein [Akkermansiaceae bacterium]